MSDWPAELPHFPQINSLSAQPDDTVLRTKNDVGPPVMRNRFTGTSDKYSFNLMMSLAQVNALKTFWALIGNGALPFNYVDPVTGATREFSFTAIYTLQSVAAVDYYLVGISICSEAV